VDRAGVTRPGTEAFDLRVEHEAKCEILVSIPLAIHFEEGYAGDVEKVKRDAQNGVNRAWNNQFKYCCPKPCKCQHYTIRFILVFEDKNDGHTPGVHVRPDGDNSNQGEWNVSQGIDLVAGHEVGHALGNIDEYGKVSRPINARSKKPYGPFGVGKSKDDEQIEFPADDTQKNNIMNSRHGVAQERHLWGVIERLRNGSDKNLQIVKKCRLVPFTHACGNTSNP